MNYWQFKFKEKNWCYWKDIGVGENESWPSPKTRNKEPNDIAIGDIVLLYRVDNKKDRGIHFVTEVSDVDFNTPKENPIELKIVIDLKHNIFKPELFGFLDVIKKINKLDQRSTSYYKFDSEDNPKKLYDQLVSYLQDGNLVEEIKDIESDEKCSPTEKESLIKARIGQGDFRNSLIQYWQGCSVTNCRYYDILIASHIKPWKDSTNEERLDVYNGLLLLPNLDKLFDKGYISFNAKGKIMLSKTILDYDSLGIDKTMKIKLDKKHHKYLEFHREYVFKK